MLGNSKTDNCGRTPIPGQRGHGDRIIHEILTGLVTGWTGCTFDAAENDFTTGIYFFGRAE